MMSLLELKLFGFHSEITKHLLEIRKLVVKDYLLPGNGVGV